MSPPATWDDAMRLALAEARAALAADDVPVGAVVLDEAGTLIGTGHNTRESHGDPTGHAEVVALRAAALARGEWRLTGCTLVVTLEPCTMCAGALVLARVDRLVFGAYDVKLGAVGSLWDVCCGTSTPSSTPRPTTPTCSSRASRGCSGCPGWSRSSRRMRGARWASRC